MVAPMVRQMANFRENLRFVAYLVLLHVLVPALAFDAFSQLSGFHNDSMPVQCFMISHSISSLQPSLRVLRAGTWLTVHRPLQVEDFT